MKPVAWYTFHKFLIAVGCTYKRKKGSHRVYSYPDRIRPIIVPEHNKPIPVFIIKNNLRILGVSDKDYLEKLKEL
jgi:predicted RNA binding protein YcfA (HicA-like mRNA interferase family)